MFRAVPCSSSGWQIVLLQPLVSSLSVQYAGWRRTAVRSQPAYCTAVYREYVGWERTAVRSQPAYCTESDDTRGCKNTICPPEDEQVTARNMLRIIM